MSIKIKVKDTDIMFDIPRGGNIPHEGDAVFLTPKGSKETKAYSVWLVEHTYNLNDRLPLGTCLITVKEILDDTTEVEEEE